MILQIISLVISSCAILISCIAIWVKLSKNKIDLALELIKNIRMNKEIQKFMLKIDYSINTKNDLWYAKEYGGFKEKEDEITCDQFLSLIDLVCLFINNKKAYSIFYKKIIRLIKYEIDRIAKSKSMRTYLWNICNFHRSNYENIKCKTWVYRNLIFYLRDNDLWNYFDINKNINELEKVLNWDEKNLVIEN